MSDDLPGWTCPDIDFVIRIVKRGLRDKLERDDVQHAVEALERLRAANVQLRSRCRELLQDTTRREQ